MRNARRLPRDAPQKEQRRNRLPVNEGMVLGRGAGRRGENPGRRVAVRARMPQRDFRVRVAMWGRRRPPTYGGACAQTFQNCVKRGPRVLLGHGAGRSRRISAAILCRKVRERRGQPRESVYFGQGPARQNPTFGPALRHYALTSARESPRTAFGGGLAPSAHPARAANRYRYPHGPPRRGPRVRRRGVRPGAGSAPGPERLEAIIRRPEGTRKMRSGAGMSRSRICLDTRVLVGLASGDSKQLGRLKWQILKKLTGGAIGVAVPRVAPGEAVAAVMRKARIKTKAGKVAAVGAMLCDLLDNPERMPEMPSGDPETPGAYGKPGVPEAAGLAVKLCGKGFDLGFADAPDAGPRVGRSIFGAPDRRRRKTSIACGQGTRERDAGERGTRWRVVSG